ncbi:MAG: phospholipid ABC transporter ATP-binding protein MlaF, partial [Gammaproteobacteria bacterium]|nr:phospholipid ABC transporter ATP-binding protein MlaF [Gammaproteobacteria bacterium]
IAAAGTPEQLRTSTAPAVHQFMTGGAEGPVAFNYPAPDYNIQLLADADG